MVMMEDELDMVAGTAASHANGVRQTHSIYNHHFQPNF